MTVIVLVLPLGPASGRVELESIQYLLCYDTRPSNGRLLRYPQP